MREQEILQTVAMHNYDYEQYSSLCTTHGIRKLPEMIYMEAATSTLRKAPVVTNTTPSGEMVIRQVNRPCCGGGQIR